ncbi:MAG: RnfH family protein [Lysobacter sp.]|nr:RnfH family protein [Lysobacter sp.]
MKVEVVIAWPRRFQSVSVKLIDGACLGDAVAAAALGGTDEVIGYAIHGQRAALADQLQEGDRVELLRGLQADPKDARRKRAASTRKIP